MSWITDYDGKVANIDEAADAMAKAGIGDAETGERGFAAARFLLEAIEEERRAAAKARAKTRKGVTTAAATARALALAILDRVSGRSFESGEWNAAALQGHRALGLDNRGVDHAAPLVRDALASLAEELAILGEAPIGASVTAGRRKAALAKGGKQDSSPQAALRMLANVALAAGILAPGEDRMAIHNGVKAAA